MPVLLLQMGPAMRMPGHAIGPVNMDLNRFVEPKTVCPALPRPALPCPALPKT